MGTWMRSSLARWLAVLVRLGVVLGVMAAMAAASSASSASPLPFPPAGGSPAAAAAPAAASLQAAIRAALGASVPAAGYSQRAELTATDAAALDSFGYSVALSARGTTALIGVIGRDSGAGAAYVFTLQRGRWSQTAELTATDAAANDLFGTSVALSAQGTTALIGAPDRSSDTGAAYVFTLRRGRWSQAAELTAADAAKDSEFGWAVALSDQGTTALIGAPGHDSGAGAAYVFTPGRGRWSQTAELTATDAAENDLFGGSVALSAQGTTALIGAPFRNSLTGAAYLFTFGRGRWSQAAELTAADAAEDDSFGFSVALSAQGTTALIGAPNRDLDTGAAYVFTPGRGRWSQAAELTATDAAEDSEFGWAVALSDQGTTALIGAPGRNSFTGAAYVFTPGRGRWSQTAELTATDAANGDGFGSSVALSALGTTALIGAPDRNVDTGVAYVYTRGGL